MGECSHGSLGSGSAMEANKVTKLRPFDQVLDEHGLFNLDDESQAEKQQCAVVASNIVRNFSFMPDNEHIMVQHRHCLETVFKCIEDHMTGEKFMFKVCSQSLIYFMLRKCIFLLDYS